METTTASTDGTLVILLGVFGLCIFGLGIAGVVFFVFYRFAGGQVVSLFSTLLRGDKDDKTPSSPQTTPPPQLRDMAKQSSFDNTLTQHMLNNEVKTGHAINSAYAAPYPPAPSATGTYPAQNAPYPPPNSPNMGYPAPNSGYPPPANRAPGQPGGYPPAAPPPPSGYPPPPVAHSGYPQAPLPPAAPKRDPFSGVNTPSQRGTSGSGLQDAEYNRDQNYIPNPGEGDDFLGGLDEDVGI